MNEHKMSKKAQAYAEELLKPIVEVELPAEVKAMIPQLAVANHEGWMKQKLAQGYVYGPVNNDKIENGPLTSPNLVPYDQLDEATKRANEANVEATLRLISQRGGTFVNLTNFLILPLAKRLHDEWARNKILDGWTYGPVTDKAKKVHRDLLSFEDMMRLYPEDAAYDITTAKEAVVKMICDLDIFILISDAVGYSGNAAFAPA